MNIKNEYGELIVSTDKPLIASNFVEIEFIFKPSEDFPMNPRALFEIVQFSRFYSNQWSLPQVSDPTAPGYVRAYRSDGKFINAVIKRSPDIYFRHGNTFHVIQIAIGEAPLSSKDYIKIIYGYKGAGGPGVQVPLISKKYSFPVYVSHKHALLGIRGKENTLVSFDELIAKNKSLSVNDVKKNACYNPEVYVKGSAPEKARVVLSSIPNNNQKVKAVINITDNYGNLSPEANGAVTLIGNSVSNKICIKDGYGYSDIEITGTGVQRYVADGHEFNTGGTSNPVLFCNSRKRIVWGEIHSHSSLSDGLGTITENYSAAKNAGLDFAAISDHDTMLVRSESLWEEAKNAAEDFYKESEFVTILGYETLAHKDGEIVGHINVYYPGMDGVMINKPELDEIVDICKKYGAIAIPHHTMYDGPFFEPMGLKLHELNINDFNSYIMPVAEIYSTHGCSEYPACSRSVLGYSESRSINAALKKGFKWGFIGGSDNHESLLGHPFRVDRIPRTINNEHMQFRHGLTAAYVTDFSREGIFDAFRRREVYATTGERIILLFTVNDKPMGSEVVLNGNSSGRIIKVEAHGTAAIKKIEVIKNGNVLYQDHPNDTDSNLTWTDDSVIDHNTYYYAKVTQADGEMAWSSPVWVSR